MGRNSAFWEIIKVVAIVFISAVIIRTVIARPYIVEGSSMEPDFHNGEYLLVERLGYYFKAPSRGDVIVFQYPNNPSINYIKRVVGLPGETVRILNNQVFINNVLLNESYLAADEKTYVSNDPTRPYEVTLSPDQYFVMGDNRQHSSDSREWGPLERHFIIGKTTLVLYPRSNFEAVASPKY